MKNETENKPLAERIIQGGNFKVDEFCPACLGSQFPYSGGWIENAWDGNPEAEANCELIFEALNVTHETGMTPSQLQARVVELEEQVNELITHQSPQ